MQHIDAPDYGATGNPEPWTNPPHRSHLCHGCDCVWRPADVSTNGVAELKTRGKADTWPTPHNEEVRAIPAHGVSVPGRQTESPETPMNGGETG